MRFITLSLNCGCLLLLLLGWTLQGTGVIGFSHEINVFWNRHIVHHSSEEFNLACALRQSISQIFGIFFFLMLPMAFIGVPTEIIAIVAPIHLFAQFWYHTTLIDKMGFLEILIVTPSHHRVHHSINPIYLDKNYGQIFIFWDKLFGTFQEELSEEPPVYGVKRAVKTWNPILINWQHFSLLVMDAIRTKNWGDKIKLWFMPTGWRPEDVKEKYPIEIIDNVSTQEKYETNASKSLKAWSWAQLIINMLLIFYLFNNIADIGLVDMMLYGLFLMASIFSYTTLMDGSKYSILTELIKMGIGFSLLYWQQGWYGIDGFISFGSIIVGAYLILSMVATIYFEVGEWKELRSKGKVRIAG